MTGNIDVVVIGGGYAGVMAANRLTQRDDISVTLINPRPGFVERLRLHQAAVGGYDAVAGYDRVLSERVRLMVDTVARIDANVRRVELAGGGMLGYDYLVYAVGSANSDLSVPGATEFAYPIATLEHAQRLRSVLDSTPITAPVIVVGAGPSGIEVAGELAEQGRSVTLACGGVLGPYLHPKGRRSVAKRLAKLGVNVLEGGETKVMEATRDTVRLADGRALPSAVTAWTAGFGVPDLAARSGLTTDAAGRLLTDETLTSVDDARVFAAGDSSAPSDMPFRMSAYNAGCLGAQAADTILARIAGEQPESLRDLKMNAMCVSVGRGLGVFQLADKDDTAIGIRVSGRAGTKLKEFACKSSIDHLIKEAGKPGSHTFPTDETHRQEKLRAKRDKALTGR
ncbi:FAD-dependent oxidoreductase [Nocardia sp. NPDC052254]|uniref:NAD(P)/FAD-dependent oxidoreductase n=1 Tax=Nocardia sp. NPDC052254 TaxID=3155681 RepID=UPI00343E1576